MAALPKALHLHVALELLCRQARIPDCVSQASKKGQGTCTPATSRRAPLASGSSYRSGFQGRQVAIQACPGKRVSPAVLAWSSSTGASVQGRGGRPLLIQTQLLSVRPVLQRKTQCTCHTVQALHSSIEDPTSLHLNENSPRPSASNRCNRHSLCHTLSRLCMAGNLPHQAPQHQSPHTAATHDSAASHPWLAEEGAHSAVKGTPFQLHQSAHHILGDVKVGGGVGAPRLYGFAVIGLCSLHRVPEVADVAGLVALEDGGTVLAVVPAGWAGMD